MIFNVNRRRLGLFLTLRHYIWEVSRQEVPIVPGTEDAEMEAEMRRQLIGKVKGKQAEEMLKKKMARLEIGMEAFTRRRTEMVEALDLRVLRNLRHVLRALDKQQLGGVVQARPRVESAPDFKGST